MILVCAISLLPLHNLRFMIYFGGGVLCINHVKILMFPSEVSAGSPCGQNIELFFRVS